MGRVDDPGTGVPSGPTRPAGVATTRTKARKRALDVLFEADARSGDPLRCLADREARAESPMNPYVSVLVHGVAAHRERIDELITRYAEGWTLDRMPAVDRSLLRLAAYELLYETEVPPAVAISEALALAGDLSTDESPGFLNGVLASLLPLREASPREEGSGRDSVPSPDPA